MITVAQIHEQLSASIGDQVYCTSEQIPDGVRFPKALRDSYIYRAILEIYRRNIIGLSGMPKNTRSRYLYTVFPNMHQIVSVTLITIDSNTYTGTIPRALYIHNGFIPVNSFNTNTSKANGQVLLHVQSADFTSALINGRNVQAPDSFLEIIQTIYSSNTTIYLHDYAGEMQFAKTANQIKLNILPLPRDPANAVPVSQGGTFVYTSNMDIEDTHVAAVISLASSFAYGDSQEPQAMEMLLGSMIQNIVPTQRG